MIYVGAICDICVQHGTGSQSQVDTGNDAWVTGIAWFLPLPKKHSDIRNQIYMQFRGDNEYSIFECEK